MRHDYTLFKRKGQKTWYFYHYAEGNKRKARSTGKTLKYEAEQEANKFLNSGKSQNITLKEFARDFFIWDCCSWIKRQHAKGRSFSEAVADSRRGHVVNYIFPAFGEMLLSSINRVDVENWLINLPLANQTKNHVLYSFGIILRDAELAGNIPFNPLEKAEPMGKDARPRDVFTVEELRKLFPPGEDDLIQIWQYLQNATLFMILATTGLRSGEIRALWWDAVLNKYSALLIKKAVKPDRHNTIGSTKTKDIRVVLLPKRAADLLKKWHDKTPYGADNQLIFYGRDSNKPLNRRTLCYQLAAAMDRAGLVQANRELVPHCFRHTFNSLMKNILPENTLRDLIGHKSPQMSRVYDHPGTEDLLQRVQGARQIIDNFWEK